MTANSFPTTYREARTGFLAEAEAHDGSHERHVHPERGPDGEELTLDVVRLGDPEARRVLLVGSGTHGVEGRCGSGIQRALLADGLFDELPPGVAVVLIHAVNPYGHAFDRRVDHDNVDVNRNFLDHAEPHPENPAYESLYDVLNPEVLEDDAGWSDQLNAYAAEHGPVGLFQATMGGQYVHPEGMQYGGVEPTWSHRTLRQVWTRHLDGVELAVNIDLHSGLGPTGIATLMQTADPDEEAASLASSWWGDVLRSDRPVDGDAITCGALGPGFDDVGAAERSVAAVLEFGTRDPITVLGAVRADNWLAHHGTRESEQGREISAGMRSAFFVDESSWQDKVVEQSREIVGRALEGCASS
jgi:hypothetical protein